MKNGFRKNEMEICVLTKKKMRKNVYSKIMRGLLLVCPYESESQTRVVLTTSQGQQKIGLEILPGGQGLSISGMRMKDSGIAFFF